MSAPTDFIAESIVRRGEVVRIVRDRAQIRLEPSPGCAVCGNRGRCASGEAKPQMIEMALPAYAQAGDAVAVAIPAGSLTRAAMLGYLLPPVAMLIGAITAEQFFLNELAAVIGAALGLAAGVLAARLISHFAFGNVAALASCHPAFQPGEHP